jgi:hypothetical protein
MESRHQRARLYFFIGAKGAHGRARAGPASPSCSRWPSASAPMRRRVRRRCCVLAVPRLGQRERIERDDIGEASHSPHPWAGLM